MIKLFKLLSILALTFSILNGYGHHGHKHYVSKSVIQQNAKKQLALLVEKEKIDKSFAGSSLASTKEKRFGKFVEWVVRFDNDKIKDKTKKSLYMFLNLKGRVLGSNYTGN
jgi:hypothetical protein